MYVYTWPLLPALKSIPFWAFMCNAAGANYRKYPWNNSDPITWKQTQLLLKRKQGTLITGNIEKKTLIFSLGHAVPSHFASCMPGFQELGSRAFIGNLAKWFISAVTAVSYSLPVDAES